MNIVGNALQCIYLHDMYVVSIFSYRWPHNTETAFHIAHHHFH